MRRLGGYLAALAALGVLVGFFIEDLKTVATVMGIASAAVVIALQDLCSSFAGYFVIVASRKLKVGDRVEIDGHLGDVIDIQLLRTTLNELQNWHGSDFPTGRVLCLPNSFIFRQVLRNFTHVHPYIWGRLDITVTFETPAAEAQAVLQRVLQEETASEFEGARKGGSEMEKRYGVADSTYEPRVTTTIADSGVTFSLVFVYHYRHGAQVRTRLQERILREFAKDPRLQFAYPTQRYIPTPEPSGLAVVVRSGPSA